MKKEMTCVACPLGCQITVEIENDEVISVTGNTCKRGDAYARTEITNPVRSIHSTVKVNGGEHPVVPCKTSGPIPKGAIFDVMKETPLRKGENILREPPSLLSARARLYNSVSGYNLSRD